MVARGAINALQIEKPRDISMQKEVDKIPEKEVDTIPEKEVDTIPEKDVIAIQKEENDSTPENEDILNPIDLRIPLEFGDMDVDQWMFVPMGMRCTSASVKRNELHVKSATYVFDWCQMNVDTMCAVLRLHDDAIEPFFRQYMTELVDHRHPEDNSWFPHDTEEFGALVDKYTRRTRRLLNDLRTEKPKLFITVTSPYEPSNVSICHKLKSTLSQIVPNCDETSRFIFVSATQSSYRIGNAFYLAIFVDNKGGDGAWAVFDKLIGDTIKTLSLSISNDDTLFIQNS